MKVTVTVTINPSLQQIAKGALDKAVEAVAYQVLNDSLDFVPKRQNTLRSSGRVKDAGKECSRAIVWNTPYAAYQWYGCWPDGTHVIRNHTTPGTTTQWAERAREQRGDRWEEVITAAFGKELG